MAYEPKPTAPVSFNAVDAILSAVHNDPVWGWLEGYAHMYPNQYFDTAAFCTAGPPTVEPLTLGDLLNVASVGTADWLAGEQRIAAKVVAALHSRLFGAMCRTPAGTAGWTEIGCIDIGQPAAIHGIAVDGSANVTPWTTFRWHFTATARGSSWCSFKVKQGSTNVCLKGGFPMSDIPSLPHSEYITINGGPFDWFELEVVGGTGSVGRVCVEQYGTPPPVDYEPPDQPAPDGYTPRVIPPTATVEDLAPILHALELKLETLLPIAHATFVKDIDLGVVQPEPIDADTNETISAVGWIGLIVTLSNVPTESDVSFGTPQAYSNLGRVSVGCPDGWYPPIPLVHSPLVLRPLPPGVDRVSVTVDPPATATVTPILPTFA